MNLSLIDHPRITVLGVTDTAHRLRCFNDVERDMTNRLMTSAAILAFVCSTALLSPAFAQDEGTGGDPVTELTDPAIGEDVGGEVTIDEGVLNDGDIPVEGGDPVPYGPEDCIDCNVAPTAVDGGVRPEGENFRGDLPVAEAFSRSESGDSDDICDHTKMGAAAKVCP
jgi:hypothetical protein